MMINKHKLYFIYVLIVQIFLLSACGNAKLQEDLNSANATITELQNNYESLANEYESLSALNKDLKSELDDLKNGASNRLYQIKKAFENNDYSLVVSLSTELHKNFNGSPEDVEAQELMVSAQSILDDEKAAQEEAAKKAQEEEKKTAEEKARSILRITKLAFSKPNSAGGVDLFIGFKNASDKVIKYIYFSVTPYNAVGDPVSCEITRKSLIRTKSTGPFNKGEGLKGNNSGYWECAWYNYHIDSLMLSEVFIEYMDGTSVTISGEDLEYIRY